MAQIKKEPLLCLCIPIYNRLAYLERMLNRFCEDTDLFKDQIYLIVSDNCSQEDLSGCCKKYQDRGLRLDYHRNEENLGSNGNFLWCFDNAKGKYVWLLGSDDVPSSGALRMLVKTLESHDLGILHLSISPRNEPFTLYTDSNEIVLTVNYWITFMSSNIFRRGALANIDLLKYKDTWLVQVPAYLNAAFQYKNNAIVYTMPFFDKETDATNNGGYNFFQVFVANLLSIYKEFVDKKVMTQQTFETIKLIEYKEYIVGYIVNLLILKKKGNFDTRDAWSILRKHYGKKPYAYYYLGRRLCRGLVKHVFLSASNFVKK